MPIPRPREHGHSRQLLENWLSHQFPDAQDLGVTSLTTPRIGYSAETLIFDAHWRQAGVWNQETLVARVRPTGYSMFPKVDLRLHYSVLEVLVDTDVPAPQPRWFQPEEGSPFGQPFFVMDRIDGHVPPEHPAYTAGGWVADAEPAQQHRMFCAAIEQMAKIHQLDWRSLGLDFLPAVVSGNPGMAAEIQLFEDYLYWVLDGTEDTLLYEALNCLRSTIPDTDRLCFNWGDPKFSNIIYREGEPVGLLDWELATVAPPENDLAFFLTYHDSITRALGHPDLPGFLSDEEAVQLYERRTGIRVRRLDYYRLWHLFRLAVMALRLTQLLVTNERIPPDADKAPHHVPMRLLRSALENR